MFSLQFGHLRGHENGKPISRKQGCKGSMSGGPCWNARGQQVSNRMAGVGAMCSHEQVRRNIGETMCTCNSNVEGFSIHMGPDTAVHEDWGSWGQGHRGETVATTQLLILVYVFTFMFHVFRQVGPSWFVQRHARSIVVFLH